MSYAAYGYGKDEDTADSPAAYAFGIKILIPLYQRLKSFLVQMTRTKHEDVVK